MDSAEFKSTYGDGSDLESFISTFYQQALGREPEASAVQAWIATGLSPLEIALGFVNSAEFTGLTAEGVVHVYTNALAGIPLDYTSPLPGMDPDIKIVEVIKVVEGPGSTVFVPTAELPVTSAYLDATLPLQGRKANGDALFGSGNPSDGYNILVDETGNNVIGVRAHIRQHPDDINALSAEKTGNWLELDYTLEAGPQDGSDGEPVNLARAKNNIDWYIGTGPSGLGEDGKERWEMDFTSSDGDSTLLHLVHSGGLRAWVDENNVVFIADSPQGTPATANNEANSTNFAFSNWFGDIPDAGDTARMEIRLIDTDGLGYGEVVMGIGIDITFVDPMPLII
ncbi:DUF4214 domain-containing protein [Candidatus Nomurabacteria bacterium]|nr:DUF4214 domain-containing protein [Candidatus Nomurabacteria bacterium]